MANRSLNKCSIVLSAAGCSAQMYCEVYFCGMVSCHVVSSCLFVHVKTSTIRSAEQIYFTNFCTFYALKLQR